MYMYVRYVRRCWAGGGGRFMGQSNPVVCHGMTFQLYYCFSSGRIIRGTKRQLTDTVFQLLLQAYEEQCAYCFAISL